MPNLFKDFSSQAFLAGFVAVLVGFASSLAIVLQAVQALNVSVEIVESWIWALGIGMGVCCLGLSWYYKKPIIIAWSTPGAALLAIGLQGASMQHAVGMFMFVALISIMVALTGAFNKILKIIPLPIAAALLAGVLFQFGLSIFTSMQTSPVMVLSMLCAFFIGKIIIPRYAVIATLVVGLIVVYFLQNFDDLAIKLEWVVPVFTAPRVDWTLIVGVGLPLFIVTMSAQNLPGIAVLKSSGYADQPITPIIGTVNLVTVLLAPFGCFALNLAAITAAICTNEEAHTHPSKRYIAGMSAGVFNIATGLLAGTVVGVFASFPAAFIATLAGIALLGTIANSLSAALSDIHNRDAAIVTFLICASGISFFGIAASFWAVIAGIIIHKIFAAAPAQKRL